MDYSARVRFYVLFTSVILLGMILIGGIFLFGIDHGWWHKKATVQQKQHDQVAAAVERIKEKNYDIMYIGEDVNVVENLNARRIYGFQDEAIYGPAALAGCAGKLIIINDPEGNVPFTPDDYEKLAELREKENMIIVYIGTAKYAEFRNHNVFSSSISEDIHSMAVISGKASFAGFADSREFVPTLYVKDTDYSTSMVVSVIMELDYFSETRGYW